MDFWSSEGGRKGKERSSSGWETERGGQDDKSRRSRAPTLLSDFHWHSYQGQITCGDCWGHLQVLSRNQQRYQRLSVACNSLMMASCLISGMRKVHWEHNHQWRTG